MNIVSFDFDLEFGFACAVLESGEQLQCCLVQKPRDAENDSTPPEFFAQIDQDDCGHSWGISGDVNSQAFEKWGENRCMTAFFNHAEKNGIELI